MEGHCGGLAIPIISIAQSLPDFRVHRGGKLVPEEGVLFPILSSSLLVQAQQFHYIIFLPLRKE